MTLKKIFVRITWVKKHSRLVAVRKLIMRSLGICVDMKNIQEIQEVFLALIIVSKNSEESRDLLACKSFLYDKINNTKSKFPLKSI